MLGAGLVILVLIALVAFNYYMGLMGKLEKILLD
jgi:Na+-transporting methylmalonyl-CoA/oxaloacetate decarboxylase gamma subunit